MKNKMKLNPKKKCIYIKNIYISKNPKLNNSINSYFEPKKINIENNPNKNPSSTICKQHTKKSVKSEHQNIYSQKQKCIIKGSYNYLSTKNIHIKTTKKEDIEDNNLFETYVDSISGRKSGQKKYEIANPFKERSNSENSLNYFKRSNTFFVKKDDKNNLKNYTNNANGANNNSNIINNKKNNENKNNNSMIGSVKSLTNEVKINLSNNSINKNIYNYKNNIKNNNNNKKNNNNILIDSSYQKKNSRKYLYKEYKDILSKKNVTNSHKFYNPLNNKINLEKEKDKEALNSSELISYKNILSPNASNSNINSISSSNEINQENINSNSMHNKNSKRIQKYILSDKKRKTKSRQNFREYKENKSKSICPEPKKTSNNSNLDNKNENNNNKFNYAKNNNINTKMKNKIINKEIDDRILYNNGSPNNNYNNINILYEHSALSIQSAFRGYLVRIRLENYLLNYKYYNDAMDILENLFINFLKNKCNIIIDKKLFLLKISQMTKIKNIKSYKSCKTFKIVNIPTSPFTETEKTLVQNKFIDLYLHKEIGERFNIIRNNNNINKEKELEKKHKEELEDVNNKIIKLMKENNILKNINEKNKINETKYKELSLENKKKDNIINIITNDNQNLAKKLKNLKDKINNLEIVSPITININKDDNNIISHYNNIKELVEVYRSNYLLFLVKKKHRKYNNLLRKYFWKYKNIIKIEKYEIKMNTFLKEKYLNNIIIIIQSNINKLLRNFFFKLYYTGLIRQKEAEKNNQIKIEKLKNIFLKKENLQKLFLQKYFNTFYTGGLLSQYIKEKALKEQNNKNIILHNLKKIIISINKRNKILDSIQYKNYFIKWTLISRILSMKAVTDEKKRKKRQKQRTKRKLEKNKSEKKFLLSTNISQNINIIDKNVINANISEKGKNANNKKKDKDNINYLEHTITTDFSLADTNNEIKNDKIIKGTEKLNELFLKAAIFYKIFGNKNNKENVNNNENNNNKVKKDIKVRLDNETDNDEDSGESSFGI